MISGTTDCDRVVFKEEQSLFRYCEGNLNFSTAFQDEDEFGYQKKKIARDPMSHRIIEKRRRDRMNNCLADLSRLIPADYLKKGRGRIEKTEIIEMAIKHMRHLQNIIATRLNGENAESQPPSGASHSAPASAAAPPPRQPIVTEHYRLGYLECLSEAMHFLVEVQGFFAGDSLCVQMMSHLHKHCDKILKGDTLNFPRQRNGETTSSNSSTSTTNGNYNSNNTSPPLGMSNSTGSNSDDNRPDGGQFYEQQYSEHPSSYHPSSDRFDYPDRRYKQDSYLPGYLEAGSDRGDGDASYHVVGRSEDSKSFTDSYDGRPRSAKNYIPRDYSTSSGIGSHAEGTPKFEDLTVKEETVEGPSQLREMLTSPKSAQMGGAGNGRLGSEGRGAGDDSPLSHTSGCETSSSAHPSADGYQAEALNYKTQNLSMEMPEGTGDHGAPDMDSPPMEAHNNMYKFKNNIKQRFSKETCVNETRGLEYGAEKSPKTPESFEQEEQPHKKQKLGGEYKCATGGYYDQPKCADPLMKDRLNLLHRRHQQEAEKMENLRFNTSQKDLESKKRPRYPSESELTPGEMATRLSFGHKSDRGKSWDEASLHNAKLIAYRSAKYSKHGKLMPLYVPQPPLPLPHFDCSKMKKHSLGVLPSPEFLAEPMNKFHKLTISPSESGVGIPIFALHSKGSFYIPLTLDQNALLPFLSLLGVTKSDDPDHKAVLHPVTISVNFQGPLLGKEPASPGLMPIKCPGYPDQHKPHKNE